MAVLTLATLERSIPLQAHSPTLKWEKWRVEEGGVSCDREFDDDVEMIL